MSEQTNSWLQSCKSWRRTIEGQETFLEAHLYDTSGGIKFNRILLHPALRNVHLSNDNGILRYRPTREQDDYAMSKLFPLYSGPTSARIPIRKCVILSVDTPKYRKTLAKTLGVLDELRLPPVSVHKGRTPEDVHLSPFDAATRGVAARRRRDRPLICGMLEVFDAFSRESKGNEWLLYFEDDVRPVNIRVDEDLRFLYNAPEDAEVIRPYIGSNTACALPDLRYAPSYGGGLTHAMYISSSGCRKVVAYARKHGWKHAVDMDLFRMSRCAGETPTGLDGWSFWEQDGSCCVRSRVEKREKLAMYHMNHIIFNQTSNPCAPLTH